MFILFGRAILNSSNSENFFQVRAQKMPYLTNVEENELIRLKTTADVGILGDLEFWAAKGTKRLSIGY